MGGFKETCAVYLVGNKEYALIETGTANSAPIGLEKMKKLPNFDPNKVKFIIPTHIHLDHAGGCGYYAKHFPNATILHHEDTLKHIIDPERIYSSTVRTDKIMADVFGKPGKINSDRVHIIKNKEIIQMDNIELEVIDSPGHHTAHYAFLDRESNSIFTGDSTGWYWKEYDVILPTTPPPQYNPFVYKETIEKFLEINPKSLFFTHYGQSVEVERLLNILIETSEFWFDTVMKLRNENADITPEQAVDYLIENYYSDFKEYPKNLIKMGFDVPVKGIWLYQEKNQPNHKLGIRHH
ncbi:MAG: Hydroxyacylglutathione hydrolase [Candidatus Heimdallarchaeota archaeon LC_3]|nr:MAG: Hydroxyacylglutathione hydrolase [Candidatus Heimdallarchaeota archaeon LC_3]